MLLSAAAAIQSPTPTIINVQQTHGGLSPWVAPLVGLLGVLIAQYVTIRLFRSGQTNAETVRREAQKKADKERFDQAMLAVCGRLSAAAVIVSGYRKDKFEYLDKVLEAHVELEYIAPKVIDDLAAKVYKHASEFVVTGEDELHEALQRKVALLEAHENFRDEVRRHFNLSAIRTEYIFPGQSPKLDPDDGTT